MAKFFTFISLPETQAFWHQNTGYLPITKAAYELTKSRATTRTTRASRSPSTSCCNKAPTANSMGIRFGNFNSRSARSRTRSGRTSWPARVPVRDGLDKMVEGGNEKLREFERINK